jgi:hypothetical protein
MKRIKWYLKQLWPLSYRTIYASEGRIIYHTWKMFMGRCYDEQWVTVDPNTVLGMSSANLTGAIKWLRGVNPEKLGPIIPGDMERPPAP